MVDLLEAKCATPSCWHFRKEQGLHCRHCLVWCESFSEEQKQEYMRLSKERHPATPGDTRAG